VSKHSSVYDLHRHAIFYPFLTIITRKENSLLLG
jgi:hypothetical protein